MTGSLEPPTSTSLRTVIDQGLYLSRLSRARNLIGNGADYLLAAAEQDLAERLMSHTKSFRSVLEFSGYGPRVSAAVTSSCSGAEICALERLPQQHQSGQSGFQVRYWTGNTLPVDPGQFDLATGLFALQWAAQPDQLLLQLHHALAPDGLLIGCVCGGDTLQEMRAVVQQAEVEIAGGLAPRFLPMPSVQDVGAMLSRAGFVMPVVDTERFPVRYRSFAKLVADLRAMAATNCLALRPGQSLNRQIKRRAEQLYAEKYGGEEGGLKLTFEVIWFAGWKPDPSQPKAKQPGSATVRLADVLGDKS